MLIFDGTKECMALQDKLFLLQKKELYLSCLELDVQDEHLYVHPIGLKKDF